LASSLAEAGRLDDVRRLIPLAKETGLRNTLRTLLSVGQMKEMKIIEALESLNNIGVEYMMIFLGDSTIVFEQMESVLSLRVLRDATQVAGWVRPEWLAIHKLIHT